MKRLIALFKAFFRVGIIQQLPAGMTADKSAMFGLIAMMQNLNVYATAFATIDVVGLTTITLGVGNAFAGISRFINTATGGLTVNLPTTAAILSALGNTIPTDGTFTKIITWVNDNSTQTITMTVGDANTTLTGTATIATNTIRAFSVTVTSATTITIQNLGSWAI